MSSTKLLLTIEDTFLVVGRGLVVVPVLPAPEARQSVECELRRPDGTKIRAQGIIAIEFVSPTPPKPFAVLMLRNVAKTDAPIGTEVWICDCPDG